MGRPTAAVYYPSFEGIGGAEKVALCAALALSRAFDVELWGAGLPPPSRLTEAFGVDASSVRLHSAELGPVVGWLCGLGRKQRRWQSDLVRWAHARQLRRLPADLLFIVDHWPPPPASHPTDVYYCLFPFEDAANHSPSRLPERAYYAACHALERALFGNRRRALATWSNFAADSWFTEQWMRRLWGVSGEVIWPPCDDLGPPLPKEPWILGVGRFEPDLLRRHNKSQDVLIGAFRLLHEQSERPYELHLAGHVGSDGASVAYVEHLRRLAEGLPVHFHFSLDRPALACLYRRASVFWHATGYGYDAERFPGRQEHFGIATVEAMSAGAVPMLYASGGSLEIIEGQGFGALWRSKEELVASTLELLADHARLAEESRRAAARARDFATGAFMDAVEAYVTRVIAGREDRPEGATRRPFT